MTTLTSTRRCFGVLAMIALLAATTGTPARAQGADASAFLKQFADQLVAIVNGPGDAATKRAALQPIIDSGVDVAAIARFCLARYWTTASPAQQQQYVSIYHQVLLNSISGHLGEYKGVSYTLGSSHKQGDSTVVDTVITRPNAPPANVAWVIDNAGGSQKIVDVVAEGTSLRLQQRADYTSYLERHDNSMQALIAALQRQVSGG